MEAVQEPLLFNDRHPALGSTAGRKFSVNPIFNMITIVTNNWLYSVEMIISDEECL